MVGKNRVHDGKLDRVNLDFRRYLIMPSITQIVYPCCSHGIPLANILILTAPSFLTDAYVGKVIYYVQDYFNIARQKRYLLSQVLTITFRLGNKSTYITVLSLDGVQCIMHYLLWNCFSNRIRILCNSSTIVVQPVFLFYVI